MYINLNRRTSVKDSVYNINKVQERDFLLCSG